MSITDRSEASQCTVSAVGMRCGKRWGGGNKLHHKQEGKPYQGWDVDRTVNMELSSEMWTNSTEICCLGCDPCKGAGIILPSSWSQPACSLHRVLVEDGTGEAVVLCRNDHVAAVLGLSVLEWEAVQNCVQSRGSVCIQHGEAPGTGVSGLFQQQLLGSRLGWQDFPLLWMFQSSLPPFEHSLATHSFLPQCLEESEDLVACYLRSLCRSPLICRPILLDFSLDRKPSKILQPGKQLLLAFLIFSVGRKRGGISPGWGRRGAFTAHKARSLKNLPGILISVV